MTRRRASLHGGCTRTLGIVAGVCGALTFAGACVTTTVDTTPGTPSALAGTVSVTTSAAPAATAQPLGDGDDAADGAPRATRLREEDLPRGAHQHRVLPEPTRLPTAEATRAALIGELRASQGDVAGAIAAFREAAMADPTSPHLLVRLAALLLSIGDAPRALGALDDALALAHDDVAALRLQGSARRALGDDDGARRAWEQALRAAAGDRDASVLLANLLVDQQDLAAASRVVDNWMEHEPGAVDGYVALARALARAGELDRAMRAVDAALQRVPDNDDALDARLDLELLTARDAQAAHTARAWAAVHGDSPSTRARLLAALAVGAPDEAQALAHSWIDDDGGDAARLLAAHAFEAAGRIADAFAFVHDGREARMRAARARLALAMRTPERAVQAVCTATNDGTAALRMWSLQLCARALRATGHVDEARRRLDSELRAHPSAALLSSFVLLARAMPIDDDVLREHAARVRARMPDTRTDRSAAAPADAGDDAVDVDDDELLEMLDAVARALEEAHDEAGARAVLEDALRARPGNAARTMLLARHFDRLGDPLQAVGLLEPLLRRGARDVETLNFVAFALVEAGTRADDAVRYARQAALLDPLGGYVLDTLGWAQLAAGLVDDATTTLARADRLSPDEAEIVFHRAVCARRRGEHDEAATLFARARALLDGRDGRDDPPLRARIEDEAQRGRP